MTIIGQQLLQPEAGWRRYDDRNTSIEYGGVWDKGGHANYWDGTYSQTAMLDTYIAFNFLGTKLRIIEPTNTARDTSVTIVIDGSLYNYNTNGGLVFQALVFEIDNLPLKEHSVYIHGSSQGLLWGVDAIDIDDTGELLPYNPFKNKLLFKSNSLIYNLSPTNTLQDITTSISNPNSITEQEFIDYGIDTKLFTSTQLDFLNTLDNYEVLYYTDDTNIAEPSIELTVPEYKPIDSLQRPLSVLYYTDDIAITNPKLKHEYSFNVGTRLLKRG